MNKRSLAAKKVPIIFNWNDFMFDYELNYKKIADDINKSQGCIRRYATDGVISSSIYEAIEDIYGDISNYRGL